MPSQNPVGQENSNASHGDDANATGYPFLLRSTPPTISRYTIQQNFIVPSAFKFDVGLGTASRVASKGISEQHSLNLWKPETTYPIYKQLLECLNTTLDSQPPPPVSAGFGTWDSERQVFSHRYGGSRQYNLGLCMTLFMYGSCSKRDNCELRHTWPTEDQMRFLLFNPDPEMSKSAREFLSNAWYVLECRCQERQVRTRQRARSSETASGEAVLTP